MNTFWNMENAENDENNRTKSINFHIKIIFLVGTLIRLFFLELKKLEKNIVCLPLALT